MWNVLNYCTSYIWRIQQIYCHFGERKWIECTKVNHWGWPLTGLWGSPGCLKIPVLFLSKRIYFEKTNRFGQKTSNNRLIPSETFFPLWLSRFCSCYWKPEDTKGQILPLETYGQVFLNKHLFKSNSTFNWWVFKKTTSCRGHDESPIQTMQMTPMEIPQNYHQHLRMKFDPS